MKIKLGNTHSPCEVCYYDGGVGSEKDYCQRCDYNIVTQLLKRVIRDNDWCLYCKNRVYVYGELECKLGDEMMDGRCKENGYMDIDYKELVDDYGIEVPLERVNNV